MELESAGPQQRDGPLDGSSCICECRRDTSEMALSSGHKSIVQLVSSGSYNVESYIPGLKMKLPISDLHERQKKWMSPKWLKGVNLRDRRQDFFLN